MSSLFTAAMAAAAATHDAVMADAFEYHPMKAADNRNAPVVVDPDRAIVLDLRAPWVDAAARFHSDGAREPGVKSEKPGHASSRPALALDLSRLPYEPRRGDRVIKTDTGEKYHVAEVVPSAPGFVRLDLNRL
jgi:hypothetical protein